MPLVALIVLFWQRRRLATVLRRARAEWAARPAKGAPSEGVLAGAAAAAGWAGTRAWRAVDTPANAARAERWIARARAAAARGESNGGQPSAA